jgi:ABC-type sugar transport system ATPase subunit
MKLLKMEAIYKAFPGVIAVDNVDLEVDRGEVLALIGENGAGKSTLMKILSGAYSCDRGAVYIDGEPLGTYSPKKAIDSGISVIYQELNYLNDLSIAENIFLGSIPLRGKTVLIDYPELRRKSWAIQQLIGLDHLDPLTILAGLSIGEKQLVEIGKAYARNVKVLVLDEPTSALNEKECQKLFSLIRLLKSEGKAIIYISHKLDEVMGVSDQVQVMRDGKTIGVRPRSVITKEEMISMMVGRRIEEMYPFTVHAVGKPLLEARHLNSDRLKDVSFTLHQGEILGFFGLMGAGCDDIVQSLFGIQPVRSGEVLIDGEKARLDSPAAAILYGLGYVPSERKTEGLILSATIRRNVTLLALDRLSKNLRFDAAEEKSIAVRAMGAFNIKAPDIETVVETLSGGNQQKVVLAKWIENNPRILILNDPTRGIDVGAKVEIYKLMDRLCQKGLGIIMVSSEMGEVMFTSDRMHVVHEGGIVAEFSKKEATQENIMKKAVGE